MSCSLDCKKFGMAAVSALVLRNFLEFIVHGVLLKGAYQQARYMTLWNPPEAMASRKPAVFLASVLFALFFTKIYTNGHEHEKPAVGQGLRYGLWMGLMTASFPLVEYMVYPVSCGLATAWVVGGFVECLIMGVAVATIYQPKHA
ncbi:MAG: hypothetical protein HY921_12885 [Elusimicrobia bacterium]|nr:hypothetical protein [Elusimicrobiota bacterium]